MTTPGPPALLSDCSDPEGSSFNGTGSSIRIPTNPFGLTRERVRATLSGSGLEAIQVTGAFEVPMGDKTVRPLVGVGQAPPPDPSRYS